MTCQIAVLRHAQLFSSGVENRIKGTMYDALRTDVHPAARRHLSVVGYAHFLGDFPVVKIVIHTDHDGIGDDDTRRGRFGRKQSQRVSGFHNQGLILRQFFEIFFDEPILQPVLAYRSGLTVGNQFIWIERDVKVEVVVDHHLKSLSCQAFAFVLVDWLAVDSFLRSVTISVNSAAGRQFLHELRRQLCVQLLRYVS